MTSHDNCEKAIECMLNGKSCNVSQDKNEVKCALKRSPCQLSGNTDIIHACITTPHTVPETVFSQMSGKQSIRLKD